MAADEDRRIVRRELPGEADPVRVLGLLAAEPQLFALTGTWAGCEAVIGSRPVTSCGSFAGLDAVFGTAAGRDRSGTASFAGGWVGYLGYGLAGRLHALPPAAGGPRQLPECWFGYYDHVLVRRDGRWYFEAAASTARRAELDARYHDLAGLLTGAAAADQPAPALWPFSCGEFEVTPSPAEHRRAVASAVELIRAGDMFQANLTLRLEAAFAGDPLALFCRGVSRLNPPYAAFLRLDGGRAVASFSPELFLRRAGRTVTTSPIKGTSPRSADPATAARQRQELTGSAKNLAENVMIVDLMRSDLSSVCQPGTVTVPRLAAAEPHPGLWHLVSDVTGTLAGGQSDTDLVAATFPPGSVTGAPKVRAMEVISALEPCPREVYTGAIGYRSPVAGLELSVAIRTFEFAADRVWLGAGGGIVADSDPAAEYAECLVKSQPLIEAVGGRFGMQAGPLASPLAALRSLAPRPAAGIFTSLPVTGGLPDGLAEHLARLAASAREVFGKELPADLPALIGTCLAGGAEAGLHTGRLRITVRPLGGPLHAEAQLEPADPVPAAVRLHPVVVADWRGGHKWADRRLLEHLAAGLRPGAQPLLTEPGGNVLETDRASVFALVDGVLRTPAADGRILPGIIRARLLAAARLAGLPVAEGPLPLASLRAATELFVTNSVRGVLPVPVPGRALPGPVTTRLTAALATRPEGTTEQEQERAASGSRRTLATAGRAAGDRPAVLVIDNYDSFTYNLVHLLQAAGGRVEVVRNDEVTAAQAAGSGAAAVVISPGPCAPAEAGICVDLVRALGGRTPVLGVCLGHQAIAVAYGGQLERVPPVHGKASLICHDGQGLFAGLPVSFPAARYHSLLVTERRLPASLQVSARTADGLTMAIRHREHPVDGVQFHPESILTGPGALLIGNFLRRRPAAG